MTLTLATQSVPKSRQRSVIPACMQARAPLSYEIQDEHGKRIAPTLAGYKLRRGTTYQLHVHTQDKEAGSWRMRLLAPRSTIETDGRDEMHEDGRMLTFHTVGPGPGELWRRLWNTMTVLPVHLDFGDGREPYRFTIPIVLRASRLRGIGTLLLTTAISVGAGAIFREPLALPSVEHVLLVLGIWLLFVVACVSWDAWKLYRQALRLMKAAAQAAPSPEVS